MLTLQELTEPAVAALRDSGLEDVLPHTFLEPRVGGNGGGIYSRLPLSNGRTVEGMALTNPRRRRRCRIGWPWCCSTCIPCPPTSRRPNIGRGLRSPAGCDGCGRRLRQRDRERRLQCHLLAPQVPGPAPRRLRRRRGPAGRGNCRRSTDKRYPAIVGIDHVLTKGAQATPSSASRWPGSDHYGLIAELRLRRSDAAATPRRSRSPGCRGGIACTVAAAPERRRCPGQTFRRAASPSWCRSGSSTPRHRHRASRRRLAPSSSGCGGTGTGTAGSTRSSIHLPSGCGARTAPRDRVGSVPPAPSSRETCSGRRECGPCIRRRVGAVLQRPVGWCRQSAVPIRSAPSTHHTICVECPADLRDRPADATRWRPGPRTRSRRPARHTTTAAPGAAGPEHVQPRPPRRLVRCRVVGPAPVPGIGIGLGLGLGLGLGTSWGLISLGGDHSEFGCQIDHLGEHRRQVASSASVRARAGSIGPCPSRYAGEAVSPSSVAMSTVICTSGFRRDGIEAAATWDSRTSRTCRAARIHRQQCHEGVDEKDLPTAAILLAHGVCHLAHQLPRGLPLLGCQDRGELRQRSHRADPDSALRLGDLAIRCRLVGAGAHNQLPNLASECGRRQSQGRSDDLALRRASVSGLRPPSHDEFARLGRSRDRGQERGTREREAKSQIDAESQKCEPSCASSPAWSTPPRSPRCRNRECRRHATQHHVRVPTTSAHPPAGPCGRHVHSRCAPAPTTRRTAAHPARRRPPPLRPHPEFEHSFDHTDTHRQPRACHPNCLRTSGRLPL